MSGDITLGATQLARAEALKAARATFAATSAFGVGELKRSVEEITALAEYILHGVDEPWPPPIDLRPVLEYEKQMVKVLAAQTKLPIIRGTFCSDASCAACAEVRRNRERIEARRLWFDTLVFV